MKLSVYDEPGYRNVAGEGWRVLLDGRPLERVVRVDTTTGKAWIHATDADGRLIVDGDHIRERCIIGSLRVERITDGKHANRPGN